MDYCSRYTAGILRPTFSFVDPWIEYISLHLQLCFHLRMHMHLQVCNCKFVTCTCRFFSFMATGFHSVPPLPLASHSPLPTEVRECALDNEYCINSFNYGKLAIGGPEWKRKIHFKLGIIASDSTNQTIHAKTVSAQHPKDMSHGNESAVFLPTHHTPQRRK